MATTCLNKDCVQGSDASQPQWPETCKYFVPEVMDSEYVRLLLKRDTEYLETTQCQHQRIDCVSFTSLGEVNHQKLVLDPDCARQLNGLDNPTHRSRVFFIDQKRMYYSASTLSRVSVTSEAWLDLLDRLMIPSTAVELLHDNNGGCGSHISYCFAKGQHPCGPPTQSCCAYHIWMKLGDFHNTEHFAYARHDFHTGRNLVLVLGTDGEECVRRLTSQFRGQSQVDLFHILLALTSSWSRQLEVHRWHLDFATQRIESQTGHSCFRVRYAEPLAPEQLVLSKSVSVTSDGIQNAMTGASNMANVFLFLSTQLRRYADLSGPGGSPEQQLSAHPETHLSDALSQCHSQTNAQLAQMRGLKSRVDAQWRTINALIAQRDSQVNIDIAAATKADSELMRGIAFVTMVFLPATFMATFFSMVFFHAGSGDGVHFVVSRWIWLYPLCTIPLTVFLALSYGPNKSLKTLLRVFGNIKMSPKREQSGNRDG